jgi:hypothetical protein
VGLGPRGKRERFSRDELFSQGKQPVWVPSVVSVDCLRGPSTEGLNLFVGEVLFVRLVGRPFSEAVTFVGCSVNTTAGEATRK